MGVGVLDIIDADKPHDADANWHRCDRWVFTEIYFSCGPNQQESLSDTMTAREAWDTLAAQYQSTSLGNIFRLTTVFGSLKHNPNEPVINFINAVVSAATELRFLGEDISDQRIKWQILGNLHADYNTLVTTLTNIDGKNNVELEVADVKEAILREESMMKIRQERDALSNHSTTKDQQPQVSVAHKTQAIEAAEEQRSVRPKRKCPECGMMTHSFNNCWYACLHEALTDYGMKRISHDQAIWRLLHIAVSAHVDDIMIIGRKAEAASLKNFLANRYKFKDLGPTVKYIGVYILRDRENKRLLLNQAPYVQEILDSLDMANCTPSAIPMDPRESWEKKETDVDLKPAEIKLYQKVIGQLMYLMLATRPDIAYSVTKLAQFAASPTERHWKGIIHVLRYLQSHDSVRLCLGNPVNPLPMLPTNVPANSLIGFFDASLMDCKLSRKSTGAYVFFLQGACVSWASKKQGLVALSSTEAEFIAGTEAARELAWIISFCEDLVYKVGMPFLLGDNQGALAMARNNDFRPRTKHIHARERYITEMVQQGRCKVDYVATRHMVADTLTKALPRERLDIHTRLMGLSYSEESKRTCKKCLMTWKSRNELYTHLREMAHYCERDTPTILAMMRRQDKDN